MSTETTLTPTIQRRSKTRIRRIMFTLALAFGVLLSVEALSFVALYLHPNILNSAAIPPSERYEQLVTAIRRILENRPNALAEFHPELGWRPRPGLDNGPDIINARGLRSAREYLDRPRPGVLRIAVFGDSFVYGSEVLTHEAWPTQLENRNADVEVLNYGVPGYGPDQAYLRFLSEGRSLGPKIILFGVSTASLVRLLNVIGVFRSPSPHFISKPRFSINKKGELVLIPNPIQNFSDLQRYLVDPARINDLGKFDYWYDSKLYDNRFLEYSHAARLFFGGWYTLKRRYTDPERPLTGAPGRAVFNKSSIAFRILTRILEKFVETTNAWGARPVVLILPDGFSVQRVRNGLPGILDPVREYCKFEHIDCIDAMEGFFLQSKDKSSAAWFINRFHYSAEGHKITRDWIAFELEHLRLKNGILK